MYSRIVTIVSAVATLTATGRSAECQATPRDSTMVLVAAVQSVKSHAPQGVLGFGFEDSLRLSESTGVEVARFIGAQFGSLKSKRVCTGATPSSCHLVGPTVFIQVTEVHIDGEQAQVSLTMLDETVSQRQPIHFVDFRVVLARSGATWHPTEVRPLAES